MISQRFFFSILCTLAAIPQSAKAQNAAADVQKRVSTVRASIARNEAKLSEYSWTERTEVVVKGDVKSTSEKLCKYDRDGKVVKTLVGDPEPAKNPRGKLAKKKKAGMTDYMERAVTLIHTYMPPDPERIDAGVKAGTAVFAQAGQGQGAVQFTNYFRDSDKYNFTFETATELLLKLSVQSYMEDPKDKVTLDAVFEKLPDGTNHIASSVLDAPEKKIQIKVTNLNYQKLKR